MRIIKLFLAGRSSVEDFLDQITSRTIDSYCRYYVFKKYNFSKMLKIGEHSV